MAFSASHHFPQSFGMPMQPSGDRELREPGILKPKIFRDKPHPKLHLLLIYGAAGTNVSQIRDRILQNWNFVHVSIQHLVDQISVCNGRKGSSSVFLPSPSLVIETLFHIMRASSVKNFVIDDLPPHYSFYQELNNMLGYYLVIPLVIYLTAPTELCLKRAIEQQVNVRYGMTWNALRNHINSYKNQIISLISHFRNKNILIEYISYISPDELFQSVKMLLGETIAQGYYPNIQRFPAPNGTYLMNNANTSLTTALHIDIPDVAPNPPPIRHNKPLPWDVFIKQMHQNEAHASQQSTNHVPDLVMHYQNAANEILSRVGYFSGNPGPFN